MKVIEIYQCDPMNDSQGGGVRYVSTLTKEILNDERLSSLLFLGQGGVDTKKGKYEYISVSKKNIGYVFFILKLFSYALNRKKLKGSVVHTHRLYFGIPFILFRWINGCKVVSSIHGRTFEVFKEKNSIFTFLVIKIFKCIERYCIAKVDYLIPVSQDVIDGLEEKYTGIYEKYKNKIAILPSMVNIKKFKDTNSNRRNLMFVGRLSDVKDIPFLISLAKKNKEFFINNKLKIDIFGDGERRKEIESDIEKFKLEEMLILHGAVSTESITKEYSSHIATIICSKHEAAPTVAIESLAASTPIISNDIGDVKSLIDNHRIGFLVDKNEKEYMDAIKKVLCNFNFDKGHAEDILKNRTPEYITKRYVDIFCEVIK